MSSGICFEAVGVQGRLCRTLGGATRVLVGDGSCECLPPAEAGLGYGEWEAVNLAPPVLERLGSTVVQGEVWAENMVGLRTELAFNVKIDPSLWAPPLNLRRKSAADTAPSRGKAPTHTAADASCLPSGVDAAHPTTSALQFSWDSNASSPIFRLCMHPYDPNVAADGDGDNSLGGDDGGTPVKKGRRLTGSSLLDAPPCSIVSALNASVGLVPPGTYTVNVSSEIGPHGQAVELRIAIDGSPPTLGQLRLGENASEETGHNRTEQCLP